MKRRDEIKEKAEKVLHTIAAVSHLHGAIRCFAMTEHSDSNNMVVCLESACDKAFEILEEVGMDLSDTLGE